MELVGNVKGSATTGRATGAISAGPSAADVSALLAVFTFGKVPGGCDPTGRVPVFPAPPEKVIRPLPLLGELEDAESREAAAPYPRRMMIGDTCCGGWEGTAAPSVRCAFANPRSKQMTTAGPSDYRSSTGELAAHADGIMDEVSDRASTLTSDVVRSIEQRPYTTLAIAGGLAFAIGALWVVKRQQQKNSFERLRSQLPSFSDAGDWLPRRWRSNAGIDWAKLRPSRWA